MRKVYVGMVCGFLVGIIDFLLIMYVLKDANVAVFSVIAWVVTGLIASVSNLEVNYFVKGILLRFLILSPSIVPFLELQQGVAFLFISGMSLFLGMALGFLVDRLAW